MAVADVSKSGKTENVTMENMTKALVGLWEYLSKEGHTEPITVPVIGTGRAGLSDGTFEDVVHETIFSFVTKSQDEFVSRKMTVCMYSRRFRKPMLLGKGYVTILIGNVISFRKTERDYKRQE